jgi:Tfp pilus assembly protein PilP
MTMKHTDKLFWLLLALTITVFTGCDDDPTFSRPFTPPVLSIKSKKETKLVKPTFKFDYSSVGKRDPFRPPYLSSDRVRSGADARDDQKTQDNTKKKSTRPKTVLERFLLQQLSVVAVITGVSNPVAMVRDPSGQGHVVRRGTLIGSNGGRISRIFPGGVVVSEVYRDARTRALRVARKIIRIQGSSSRFARRQFSIGGKKVYVDGQGRVREVPQWATPGATAGSKKTAVKTLRTKTDRLFRARNNF